MGFVRTYKKRTAFLNQLELGTSESAAARAADGTLREFKKWRSEDTEFAKDWDDSIEAGTDFLEDAAFERALTKSDPLAMFMLKARRPDKYDRGGKLELTGKINVEGAKATLLNRLARLQAEGKVLPGTGEAEPEVSSDKPEEGEAPETRLLPAPGTTVPQRGGKRRAVEQGGRRKTAASG